MFQGSKIIITAQRWSTSSGWADLGETGGTSSRGPRDQSVYIINVGFSQEATI